MALPSLSAWGTEPLRLIERSVPKHEPKALACYGLLVHCPADKVVLPEQIWLRFVDGRPVSDITTQFLDWCCAKLTTLGKRTLILIWDNASWHLSRHVRRWIGQHNRAVKRSGRGVRIVRCYLPTKSPWLNPIEPHWGHAKRRTVEPGQLLSMPETIDRVCQQFGCPHEPFLTIPDRVA